MWLTVLLLLQTMMTSRTLKVTRLLLDEYAEEGEGAEMGCEFDLEGDRLYSVNWYKDNQEFYRYLPRDHPKKQQFYVKGVIVRMGRSDKNRVYIDNMTRDTSGTFTCEVEAGFKTSALDKEMKVVNRPKSEPRFNGIDCNGDSSGISCCEETFTAGDNDNGAEEIFIQSYEYKVNCTNSCKVLRQDSYDGNTNTYKFDVVGATESVKQKYPWYTIGEAKNKNKCWCELQDVKLNVANQDYQTCVFRTNNTWYSEHVEGALGWGRLFESSSVRLLASIDWETSKETCCKECKMNGGQPTTKFIGWRREKCGCYAPLLDGSLPVTKDSRDSYTPNNEWIVDICPY